MYKLSFLLPILLQFFFQNEKNNFNSSSYYYLAEKSSCVEVATGKIAIFAGQALRVPILIQDSGSKGFLELQFPKITPETKGLDVKLAYPYSKIEPKTSTTLWIDIFSEGSVPEGLYTLNIKYNAGLNKPRACEKVQGRVKVEIKVKQPSRLSENELRSLSKILASREFYNYTYVEFINQKDKNGSDELKMVRLDKLPAQILMRHQTYLKRIKNKFFSDGQGGLVYFGKLNRPGEVELPYVLNLFTNGMILGIDVGNDQVLDYIIGFVGDRFSSKTKHWILENVLGRDLIKCLIAGQSISPKLIGDIFSAANTGDTSLCSLLPNAQQKADSSGGGFGLPFPIQDLLGEPVCTDDKGPPPVVDPPSLDEVSGSSSDKDPPSNDEPDPLEDHFGPPDTDDEFDKLISDLASTPPRAEHIPSDPGGTPAEPSGEGPSLLPDIFPDVLDRVKDVKVPPFSQGVYIELCIGSCGKKPPDRTPTEPPPSGGGPHGFSPPRGPDGLPEASYEDRRCASIEQQAAQGNLFMNKRFCNADLLTCLKKQEDPIFRFTGGRCEEEIGPDDRTMYTCEINESPLRPGQRGACSGPADQPCRPGDPCCLKIGSSDLKALDLIISTPLGGILANLCKADRCSFPRY
jgi:hypothetical protein